jgi:hypothetical protein
VQWDSVWQLYRHLGGLPCDVRQWKVPDIAIDEVSRALSMHAAPLTIWTIVVPVGVAVLLGRSGGLCLSIKIVPKFKVRICIFHIYVLDVSPLPRLGEPVAHSLELLFLLVCVHCLPIT